MIEMKSAEHKDCFTIAMFFPPPPSWRHGVPQKAQEGLIK